MRTLPWITVVLALVLALNPMGLDAVHSAFMSNEALSRNIWQPIVLIVAGVLLTAGIVEWLVRRARRNRTEAAA
jgi:hypothetical protein